MPYEIERCKQGHYWIRYSGFVDLELRLEALHAVESSSEDIPIRGNIIDFRAAELLCSFSDQLEFATKATDQFNHRGRKAAYLVNDKQAALVEILHLAMSNRGIETQIFTDELAAINWLTGKCFRSCEDFKGSCCPMNMISQETVRRLDLE
jgi:hypothetical protein